MGWNGTKTWAVSDTLTASDLNSYVRDNTAYLVQKAEVAMKKTGDSLSNNSTTATSFTAGSDDLFDTFAMHLSGNPTRLSAVTGQLGTHWCWAVVAFANNTTGRRNGLIRKDGSTAVAQANHTPSAGGECSFSLGGAREFTSAGQYVELLLFQDSGGSLGYDVVGFGMWHVGG